MRGLLTRGSAPISNRPPWMGSGTFIIVDSSTTIESVLCPDSSIPLINRAMMSPPFLFEKINQSPGEAKGFAVSAREGHFRNNSAGKGDSCSLIPSR